MLAEVPKWMRPFVNHRNNKLEFTYPIRMYSNRIWFSPARAILDYNRRDCVNWYPDWLNGRGTKVRPFFGHVVILEEGCMIDFAWWKHLEKYDPKDL